MHMKVANSFTVGRPSAMMLSMQKVSTVVRLASRSLKPAEDLLIKVQLEFGVYFVKSLMQHDASPSRGMKNLSLVYQS